MRSLASRATVAPAASPTRRRSTPLRAARVDGFALRPACGEKVPEGRMRGMPYTVAIALGSNLGDRAYNLRAAIDALGDVVRVVRISRVRDTAPVDAPAGSPHFLNM